jgi:hypothetical protein
MLRRLTPLVGRNIRGNPWLFSQSFFLCLDTRSQLAIKVIRLALSSALFRRAETPFLASHVSLIALGQSLSGAVAKRNQNSNNWICGHANREEILHRYSPTFTTQLRQSKLLWTKFTVQLGCKIESFHISHSFLYGVPPVNNTFILWLSFPNYLYILMNGSHFVQIGAWSALSMCT